MSFISFKNIEKHYGSYHALKNVSLEIDEGKFVVLLGPSGAGKSTLLRILAGLENITSGKIILDGKDITNIEPANRDLAMVFQNYTLYPHMSVYKNLSYGLENRKISKNEIKARIDEVADMLEIADLINRKPSELSGGQRQRVAMGKCIVRKPKVFLFDEPLSNLDAQLRTKMRFEIRNLQKKLGITTIFVTHDQTEAMTMADEIVLMNYAEIVQIGSPIEIYNCPNSIFAAKFIGIPQIGMLAAKLKDNILSDELGHFSFNIKNKNDILKDKDLLLGIRSEHLHAENKDEKYKPLKLYIQNIENLGSHLSIHCIYNTTNNTSLISNTDIISATLSNKYSNMFEIGKEYTFYFNPKNVKLFDKETSNSLGFLHDFL